MDLASLFGPIKTPDTYSTQLNPVEEMAFRQWVQSNNVPFDADAGVTDYDMRGFWQAMQAGRPNAASAVNPFDGSMHYPDTWKTPAHETFSNESQWATPDAPAWTQNGQLIAPNGRVVYDERAGALASMFGGGQ